VTVERGFGKAESDLRVRALAISRITPGCHIPLF